MGIELEQFASTLKRLETRLRGEFQVRSLHVFGSVARGNAGPGSDIDVLVEFEGTPTFAGFMDLKFLLEDECGVRVDLVTVDALRPALRPAIMAEAKRVA